MQEHIAYRAPAQRRHTTVRAIGAVLISLGLLACAGSLWATSPTAGAAQASAAAPSAGSPKPVPAKPIDINSASRAQLKTLPGIGDAEADKIIAARPYLSKADLASRNVIPTGTYLSLKNRIIAKQKSAKPAGKA
jgi:DNA uptake protein ComE-like DNA-binding protein